MGRSLSNHHHCARCERKSTGCNHRWNDRSRIVHWFSSDWRSFRCSTYLAENCDTRRRSGLLMFCALCFFHPTGCLKVIDGSNRSDLSSLNNNDPSFSHHFVHVITSIVRCLFLCYYPTLSSSFAFQPDFCFSRLSFFFFFFFYLSLFRSNSTRCFFPEKLIRWMTSPNSPLAMYYTLPRSSSCFGQ